jgi:hypothetical protein
VCGVLVARCRHCQPPDLFVSFSFLSGSGSSKKVRKELKLVWHSVIWVIWKSKKESIFNNRIVAALEVVDESNGLA